MIDKFKVVDVFKMTCMCGYYNCDYCGSKLQRNSYGLGCGGDRIRNNCAKCGYPVQLMEEYLKKKSYDTARMA